MPVGRVRSWLFDEAFPFWASVGVDRAGPGFVEQLTLAGEPAAVDFKRVRVQARQIYCFCQAQMLGWPGPATEVAGRAVDLLLSRAWLGVDQGWASMLTRSGEVLDDTPDLYDIAFVLFALGWWHRVTGDRDVLAVAHQTLDFLAAKLRHPSGRGYLHRLGGTALYQQNPHMHLTEAMIVLRDASGEGRFGEEASSLVRLCVESFFDPGTGTLAEYFDQDWCRDAGPAGRTFEPGHHFEWVWILKRYLDGEPGDRDRLAPVMGGLFDFAVRHGRDPASCLVYDEIAADGAVLKASHRLWPQAEVIKAWLAISELDGRDPVPAVTRCADNLFRYYLDTSPRGTWIEHRRPDLGPEADKIPASSFYHVVLALAEILGHADAFAAAQGSVHADG